MMLEPHDLRAELVSFFQPKALRGKRVLITAGPTSEKIDPVRVLTNRSSGKMGYAIAQAAREAGAQVVLVSGPTALNTPRSEEHTSELQSLMRISYAVFCLKKNKTNHYEHNVYRSTKTSTNNLPKT